MPENKSCENFSVDFCEEWEMYRNMKTACKEMLRAYIARFPESPVCLEALTAFTYKFGASYTLEKMRKDCICEISRNVAVQLVNFANIRYMMRSARKSVTSAFELGTCWADNEYGAECANDKVYDIKKYIKHYANIRRVKIITYILKNNLSEDYFHAPLGCKLNIEEIINERD